MALFGIFVVFLSTVIISNSQLITSKSAKCGGTITDEVTGLIRSPGFPDHDYEPNQNCAYEIVAPPNYVIAYFSTHMDLEGRDGQSELCVYDSVSIYDGNTLLDTYCGKEVIYPNATTNNILRIEFITDFAKEEAGFEIKWAWLDLDERNVELRCHFDDPFPLCAGWTNQNSNFQWLFGREHTPSANTGPVSDHTTGNASGRYAYIEGSNADRNSTAILQSPAILSDHNNDMRCVHFWYHMFGEGVGDLRVYLTGSDSQRSVLIAQINGDKNDAWWEAKYTVTLNSLMSTITFEGRRGINYMSDIAIDDIEITVGSCKDEDVGFNFGAPGLGLPSIGTGPWSGINTDLIPKICAGNLENYDCRGECILNCDNYLSSFPELCTRTCLGNCACPIVTPILHETSCIAFISCPTINLGRFETPTEQDDTASQQMTTVGNQTIRAVNHEEKNEKIHEKLINLFISALSSIVHHGANNN